MALLRVIVAKLRISILTMFIAVCFCPNLYADSNIVIPECVKELNTGLPIVIINTPDAVSVESKTIWLPDATMTILNPDLTVDYQGTMSIKGRGNSTWILPKKPFALKLDEKSKILGMKKHKRWCLLANLLDRTLIRNAVAFEIARNTGLAWTPSGRHVEVVLNGEHIGNYYLCEQIKVDKNRLHLAEVDANVTDADSITGGYIFELDKSYNERFRFRPTISDFPWQFKDPDVVNDAQYNYAVSYVNAMEEALYDNDKFAAREFEDYMDLDSYVDWWIVNELTMNNEVAQVKSCYMYKDINGKMNAGPVWDYDWGTFHRKRIPYFFSNSCLYYPRLFEDQQFLKKVKERWNTFKPALESNIPQFIDSLETQLKASDSINIKMWPQIYAKPNGDEDMDFADAYENMKDVYLQRLKWMDEKIQDFSHDDVSADEGKMLSFALTDGTNTYEAFNIDDAYIDIQVPQGTDLSAMTVVFTHDGARVDVEGVEQVSGESKHDFCDFTNPVCFVVTDATDNVQTYTVRLFNLPIVFVETEDQKDIVSKEDWLTSTFTIRNQDGTVESLGTTNIKGRGNTSWSQQDKKPYTIKLEKKQKVLGMNKHKRWHLLTTYGNAMSFFRDDLMFWMARHTASLGWAPHGRFAELFVNGEHKGLYWICEKISIDKNRVNIAELTPEDTDPEAVTGGYLLEFADFEEPQFDSDVLGLHYCLNDPDENVPDEQLNYIKDYINNLEASLVDEERFANREYEDYLDVDTWIDYWFMHEMAEGTDINLPGKLEGLSCFCYKDRGGKLKAGPVWDMHYYAKSGVGYHAKDKLYYKQLFKDLKFVQRVKDKWYGSETEVSFPDLMGNGPAERVDSIRALIQQAGDRDLKMWGKDETVAYQAERAIVKYNNNVRWMNFCVKDLPYVTGLDDPTEGVRDVPQEKYAIRGIYSTSGIRTNVLKPGINIIRMEDGTVRKVMIK